MSSSIDSIPDFAGKKYHEPIAHIWSFQRLYTAFECKARRGSSHRSAYSSAIEIMNKIQTGGCPLSSRVLSAIGQDFPTGNFLCVPPRRNGKNHPIRSPTTNQLASVTVEALANKLAVSGTYESAEASTTAVVHTSHPSNAIFSRRSANHFAAEGYDGGAHKHRRGFAPR